MRLSFIIILAIATTVVAGASPSAVDVKKIWDAGEHNAFTDLAYCKDMWYCVFREAAGHVKGDGGVRIITSPDGDSWTSRALLQETGVDLRDPKICVTPDDKLMITMGGSYYRDGKLVGRRPRVSFSTDGRAWSNPTPVCRDGDWLWRVTWHGDTAYGASYSGPVADRPEWALTLMRSKDGLDWQPVTEMAASGKPNETTLRFRPDGVMLALIRREEESRNAFFGESKPPYTEWRFNELNCRIGGPNFILLPDGNMWAGGRLYGETSKTALGPQFRRPFG
ncbi:MAG TPA: exo-alpha-sialidase [Candidatus Hydrogenedentes bacterium]|nr:exo-alpha-sialidase [Candidatus Hydrogenedentota bacterium]